MDWNGDGHLDALVGGYAGDVRLFFGKPTGGFSDGSLLTFENGETFIHAIDQGEGKEPKKDAGAMIWCVDWDQDGDLDLLSGWFYGGLFLNRNLGSKTEPKLSTKFEPLQAGDGNIDWGYQVQPSMADWDGDGHLDLIYSSLVIPKSGQGSVSWCRNLADSGEPRFAAPEALVWSGLGTQAISTELGLKRAIGANLMAVPTDWDGDGNIDLIVSDTVRMLQPKTDLNAEQKERLKVVLAETLVGKEYATLVTQGKRPNNREFTTERNELTEELPKKMKRGRLWLLQRKVDLAPPSSKNPISLGLKSKNLGNGRYKITMQAHILDGWHAYETKQSDSPYIPLRVQLQLPEGFTFEDQWTQPEGEPDLEDPSLIHLKDKFSSERIIVANSTANLPLTITGEVSYQICDEFTCQQPSKKTLEVTINQ